MTRGINAPNPLHPKVDWRDIQALRADLTAQQARLDGMADMINALANRVLVLEAACHTSEGDTE